MVILLIAAIIIIMNPPVSWPGFTVVLGVLLFMVYLCVTTVYIIKGDTLWIKSGFFYNLPIEIISIQKVSETNNPLSSPAMSLDRLEIVYGKKPGILISPVNKEQFIADLKHIHPGIEIVYWKK